MKWLLENNALPGTSDCELNCVTSQTDMGSFMCNSQCRELCKVYLPKYIEENLIFPKAMTQADKALVKKYPVDAYWVSKAKDKALSSTSRIFGDSFRNDESDAFRHFVWSGLLLKSIGEEKARLFLEAHEKRKEQPSSEFEMDTFNNSEGIKSAKNLIKNKKFSLDFLEKEALRKIKSGELKILSKQGVPSWRKK